MYNMLSYRLQVYKDYGAHKFIQDQIPHQLHASDEL